MREYLRAFESKTLDTVNHTIGKEVKKAYKLTNVNDREDNPVHSSKVIKNLSDTHNPQL
jgi:hypothetical protein